jgi:hypothetical protein
MAMAVVTLFWLPEWIVLSFWLVILISCAYIHARYAGSRHFLHGLLTGLLNNFWMAVIHIIFSATYFANHPEKVGRLAEMPGAGHPLIMMAVMGQVVGLATGLVLGLFCSLMSNLVKRTPMYSRERFSRKRGIRPWRVGGR